MELFSKKFKEATLKALESRKLVLAAVHWKAKDKLITEAKSREDSETVTQENRDQLPAAMAQKTPKSMLKTAHGFFRTRGLPSFPSSYPEPQYS